MKQKETPFERFQSFAKKIIQVPKSEIDAKQKEWDSKKKEQKTQ